MANTSKGLSERDANQTLQHVYNIEDASLTTSGFLTAKVGHKMTFATSTTSVADDTVTISWLDNGTSLYSVKLIYTDGTRTDLLSAERIS